MDVSSLEPEIYAILTAPAVDLATVSAKRVRAQLKANIPSLGDDWVREHKEQIDKITAQVFDRVRSETEARALAHVTHPAPPSPAESSPPPAAGKRKRSAEEDADAEYARKLASELNGHNTRGGSAGASRKKPSKKKAKKSAEEIEDSDEDVPKKPSKPKKAKKKTDEDEDGEPKKKGGYQKEYSLSPAMAEFTGVSSLSRPQIVKKLWDHIKAHNLQNPDDKREIICDEPMKQVLGVDRVNMFKMNKLIGVHILDKPE